MILVLDVISHNGSPLSSPLSARFDENGGSIGRREDNLLVLPDADKVISREHAAIRYEGGRFLYTDKSLSGTELCGQNRALLGESVFLEEGERLKIGGYELLVRFEAAAESFGGGFPAFENADKTAFTPMFGRAFNDQLAGPAVIPDDFSFDDLLGSGEDPSEPAWLGPAEDSLFADALALAQPEEMAAPFIEILDERMDAATAAQEFIDDPATTANRLPPLRTPEPATPPPAAQEQAPPLQTAPVEVQKPRPDVALAPKLDAGVNLFQCFMEGAGLESTQAMTAEEQAEAMTMVGQVFRQMVEGLMIVLRARAATKSEIRADVTQIQGERNNPLKFIPTAEGAMRAMLYPKYRIGYLDPAASIQESFADIRNHQMAMPVGMKAHLDAMLQKFDPAAFEKLPEGGGVFLAKEAKYWKAFCTAYPKLKHEALDDLFKSGSVFALAYEEQVRRLNEANRKN
jgi:type VI secretion system FHA domain protein